MAQTGTVDMLVFVKLNGLKPGMESHSSLKGEEYGKYFQHSVDNKRLNATSKVVTRVLNPNPEHVLPWWRDE